MWAWREPRTSPVEQLLQRRNWEEAREQGRGQLTDVASVMPLVRSHGGLGPSHLCRGLANQVGESRAALDQGVQSLLYTWIVEIDTCGRHRPLTGHVASRCQATGRLAKEPLGGSPRPGAHVPSRSRLSQNGWGLTARGL